MLRWFGVGLANIASVMAFWEFLIPYTFLIYAIVPIPMMVSSYRMNDKPIFYNAMVQFITFLVVSLNFFINNSN